MPKCDFNKVALQLWHECSPVNLLHIFSTPSPKNTYEKLLLFMNPLQLYRNLDSLVFG